MIELALYASDSMNLRMNIKAEWTEYTPKGDVLKHHPHVYAQFERGVPPDWALTEVTSRLDFRGHPEDLPITARMGIFDSDIAAEALDWSPDTKKMVEDYLDRHQGASNNYIRIEVPKVAAPWPKITELTVHGRRTVEVVADKMVETAAEIGVDLDAVVLFVKQEIGNVAGWDNRLVDAVNDRRPRETETVEELVEA